MSIANSYLLLFLGFISLSCAQNYTIGGITVTTNVPALPPVIGSTDTYTITCTVIIDCSSTCSNDTLTVDWTLNGSSIDSNNFSQSNASPYSVTSTVSITSTLTTVGNITVDHAGIYVCNGLLDSGDMDSGNNTINVTLPTPTVTVDNITADVNSNAALICTPSISGVSGITITYAYTWSRLTDNDDTLHINGVTVSNAGEYTCTVTASHSSQYVMSSTGSGNGILTVRVTGEISITAISNAIVAVGDDHTFMCNAMPPNGLQYSYQWTSPTNSVSNTNSYNITSASVNSAGIYTCSVTANAPNTYVIIDNSSNTATATLYVTNTSVTPVNITRLVESTYSTFSISCTVNIVPSTENEIIMFTWSPSNFYTMVNNQTTDSTNTLTVSVNASGTYMLVCTTDVTITGSVGTATSTSNANVIVKDEANPIQPLLNEVTVTPNMATIRWTIPQVAYTPENYTIQYGTSMDNLSYTSSGNQTINIEDYQFITDTNIQYQATIRGLSVGIQYFYRIVSNNSVGSNVSIIGNFTTSESIPVAPSNIKLVAINSTALNLSWDPPDMFRGDIIDYNYTCEDVNATVNYNKSNMSNYFLIRNVILTGLQPFRQYTCNVTAATRIGAGEIGIVYGVTDQAAPAGPPLSFVINSTNTTVLNLYWNPPDINLRNGIIVSYRYYCMVTIDILVTDTVTTTDAIVYSPSFKPYTNYTCCVNASTSVGSGPATCTIGTTGEDVPSEVNSLNVVVISDSSVNITWSIPTNPNGIITNYAVVVRNHSGNALVAMETANSSFYTINNKLDPYIPYVINVSAYTSVGRGSEVTLIIFTKQGTTVSGVTVSRINDTSIDISWTPLTLLEARGFFNYTVILDPSNNQKRQTSLRKIVPSNESNVVFSGLDPGVSYSVSVYANTIGGAGVPNITVIPPAVQPPVPPNTTTVVVIVILGIIIVAVLLVVIIILVYCILKNKRTKREMTVEENAVALQSLQKAQEDTNGKELELVGLMTTNTDDINSEKMRPVLVTEFASHVQKLHYNRDLGFEDEYKSFKNNPQGSYTCAKLPHNTSKNRFDNVFPYDNSRVELTPLSDTPGSDYINASFINGYKRSKAYIAAQGPLVNTVSDFWRMVWEFQLPTIVMLTELVERGIDKCTCYWPRSLNETIDVGNDLKITLVEQQQFVDYKMKKLLLVNTSQTGGGRLDITHYHFLAWPDHGVPVDKTVMLAFIRRVRQSHPTDGPPLIVHCSAGVGRTGTFITLDSMLQRLNNDNTLNIYEFIADMRSKRVLMVQTEAQYMYIHDALSEYITCGDTSITTKALKFKMDELSSVSEHKSGYEKQFILLNQVCRQPLDSHCTDALSKQNINKNRYSDRLNSLPYDMTRVRLKTTSGIGDYINASYVDGYKHRGAFLATQAPLDSTVEDFWRMIWEQWSSSIVLLCDFEENEESTCARYWPNEVNTTTTYGKMNVKFMSEEKRIGYIVRKFMISQENTYINLSTGSADHLVCTQYHYTNWSQNDKPKDETPILKLLDQLLHNQMNTGNKAITVMCSDGVGRTGAFMCIYSLLERIKIEGVADAFQYIKGARFLRPGLVQNPKQYEFCHEVVLEYLNSFDAYHNF